MSHGRGGSGKGHRATHNRIAYAAQRLRTAANKRRRVARSNGLAALAKYRPSEKMRKAGGRKPTGPVKRVKERER